MAEKEYDKTNTTTTDTMSERGRWIKVGILPIYARPLTIVQIQEMAEEMERAEIDLEEKYVSSAGFVLSHSQNVVAMKNIIIKSLFRSSVSRFLFGWYVSHNLATKQLKEAYSNIHASFDYDFFLNGLIFLQSVKETKTTKKTEESQTKKEEEENTSSATARGQWLEA